MCYCGYRQVTLWVETGAAMCSYTRVIGQRPERPSTIGYAFRHSRRQTLPCCAHLFLANLRYSTTFTIFSNCSTKLNVLRGAPLCTARLFFAEALLQFAATCR